MRLQFVFRLDAIAFLAAIASGQTFACQCSNTSVYEKTGWEVAKLETERSATIFEGTPERFELNWSVLRAKEGELIPTETEGPNPNEWPGMVVTFRVGRAYKGDLGQEIEIKTGLGGGDCGAVFAPGLTYLVFAWKSPAGDLGVSMCSPGDWIGGNSAAVEFRYLRKEHPIPSDLAPRRRWNAREYAAQEGERRRDSEEFSKRYAAVTGEICGTVAPEKTKDEDTGIVSFLSTAGFSPAAHPVAYVGSDGSFCSGRLGPGKCYLYFTRGSEQGLTSAVYYPGVGEKEKATILEVNAGQAQSELRSRCPFRKRIRCEESSPSMTVQESAHT